MAAFKSLSLFIKCFQRFHISAVQRAAPIPPSLFWLSVVLLVWSLHPPVIEQNISRNTPYPILRFAFSAFSFDLFLFLNQQLFPCVNESPDDSNFSKKAAFLSF